MRGGHREGAGRKPGSTRPPKPTSRVMSVRLKVSAVEKQAIESAAHAAGQTVSDYMRQMIFRLE